jgi:hypothetical protein
MESAIPVNTSVSFPIFVKLTVPVDASLSRSIVPEKVWTILGALSGSVPLKPTVRVDHGAESVEVETGPESRVDVAGERHVGVSRSGIRVRILNTALGHIERAGKRGLEIELQHAQAVLRDLDGR